MKIGTAVGSAFYSNADTCSSYDMILKNDFNILVAENEMKYDAIEPKKGVFNFSKPDIHVNYAADPVKWLAYQAEDYRKLICICLDKQNCKTFVTWGFTDKYSWIPNFTNNLSDYSLIFDTSYSPKPAYTSIIE